MTSTVRQVGQGPGVGIEEEIQRGPCGGNMKKRNFKKKEPWGMIGIRNYWKVGGVLHWHRGEVIKRKGPGKN